MQFVCQRKYPHKNKNKLTNNGDIEVIMVSAQKRLQSVQEVPISMSAFSGDMIKQIGATDFKGLTDVTPGFSVVGGSDAFPSILYSWCWLE